VHAAYDPKAECKVYEKGSSTEDQEREQKTLAELRSLQQQEAAARQYNSNAVIQNKPSR
jgi:hypothetical protein